MVSDGQLNSGDGHTDVGRPHSAGSLERAAGPGGCADQGQAPRANALIQVPVRVISPGIRSVLQPRPYTPTGKGLLCASELTVTPAKRPCSRDIKPVHQ